MLNLVSSECWTFTTAGQCYELLLPYARNADITHLTLSMKILLKWAVTKLTEPHVHSHSTSRRLQIETNRSLQAIGTCPLILRPRRIYRTSTIILETLRSVASRDCSAQSRTVLYSDSNLITCHRLRLVELTKYPVEKDRSIPCPSRDCSVPLSQQQLWARLIQSLTSCNVIFNT